MPGGYRLPHPALKMTSRGWKFPVDAGIWVVELTQRLFLRQPHYPHCPRIRGDRIHIWEHFCCLSNKQAPAQERTIRKKP